MACLPSELTKSWLTFDPCELVITTHTSASPGTSEGRISDTFHVIEAS